MKRDLESPVTGQATRPMNYREVKRRVESVDRIALRGADWGNYMAREIYIFTGPCHFVITKCKNLNKVPMS